MPQGSAYVIGESGLTTALHEAGFVLTDTEPDYVVLGETRTYSFEAITRAIRLVEKGARFIATNPDATGPSAEGSLPVLLVPALTPPAGAAAGVDGAAGAVGAGSAGAGSLQPVSASASTAAAGRPSRSGRRSRVRMSPPTVRT